MITKISSVDLKQRTSFQGAVNGGNRMRISGIDTLIKGETPFERYAANIRSIKQKFQIKTKNEEGGFEKVVSDLEKQCSTYDEVVEVLNSLVEIVKK
jgi:hypothetical protein